MVEIRKPRKWRHQFREHPPAWATQIQLLTVKHEVSLKHSQLALLAGVAGLTVAGVAYTRREKQEQIEEAGVIIENVKLYVDISDPPTYPRPAVGRKYGNHT